MSHSDRLSARPTSHAPAIAPSDPTASLLESRQVGSAPASAWHSTSVTDDAWDAFLQTTPLGHFQQSSIWTSIKAAEGWRSVRIVVRQHDSIIGGFQILIRSRGFLREGFLNKGPVVGRENPALTVWMLELIETVAKTHGIDALVAQAPDADQMTCSLQEARAYTPNGLANIITSTFCVPLGPHLSPAESRMRRTIRLEARQAARRGVVIREGGDADIPEFFRMMCRTCQRQKTSPNPATEDALLHLWRSFNAKGLARLTIADCDGKPTAGLLALRFGNRVTQWKKGWTEEFREKHPNTLLAFESILWSERNGASLVDFVGGDRTFARAILAGAAPDKGLLASRYFFILGFGAEPVLLPLGRVWIRNRFGRLAYRAICPVLKRIGRIED